MRILGVDPGLATVGIGVIEVDASRTLRAIDWMAITTKPGLPLPERLLEIQRDLRNVLEEFKPELVVVEKLYFATNEKTAMDVAHARGTILLTIAEKALPLLEPTPLQMKLGITGDGQADKQQVQTMLVHLLKLSEIPHPDDAADALALAVYGALHQPVFEAQLAA